MKYPPSRINRNNQYAEMICPVCELQIDDGQSRKLAVINGGLYKYCHRHCIDERIKELEAENQRLRGYLEAIVRIGPSTNLPETLSDLAKKALKATREESKG